jgi:hypothetical protein
MAAGIGLELSVSITAFAESATRRSKGSNSKKRQDN